MLCRLSTHLLRLGHQLYPAFVLASALGLLPACAGRFDGEHFQKPRISYRIGHLDEGWTRVRIEDMDLAFHRPGQGSIGVHATCHGYDDVPPRVLLEHLLFGMTARTYRIDEEVTLDGRGARHAVIDAELDGVPVRLEVYLLTRARCVFDLSYVSGLSAPAHAVFTRFAQAFRIEDGHDG